ncbi:hypothetical protein QVD17_08957 [Tagetes erecta]|uniref:Uncharacterized protein n=1 Tax=Tagetes erecta TaxID=13708 RepID=A0AAD8KZM2_TARER|nr:hypothetical protein QVD17_08957 [Tagetes erecta]
MSKAESEAHWDDEVETHIGESTLYPFIASPIVDPPIARDIEHCKESSLVDVFVVPTPKSTDGGEGISNVDEVLKIAELIDLDDPGDQISYLRRMVTKLSDDKDRLIDENERKSSFLIQYHEMQKKNKVTFDTLVAKYDAPEDQHSYCYT